MQLRNGTENRNQPKLVSGISGLGLGLNKDYRTSLDGTHQLDPRLGRPVDGDGAAQQS